MRPTLRQLQYFVAVADAGRFIDAADRLSVSQPSLSAQIADMEAELGIVLFERGRSGVALTPLGADLITRARLILRDVEDFRAAARQSDGQLTGRLQLGVVPSIGPYLLPDAAKRLHAMFPELRLAVKEERTVDLGIHLSDGRLDAVISNAADHPNMCAMELFREQLWVSMSSEDPLALEAGRPIVLADLKGRVLLSLGQGHGLSQITQDLARQSGAHISTEYEGTSLDAIRQMAVMGAGLAVLPSLYVASEARWDKDLIVRRVNHDGAYRDISLIWRPASPLGAPFLQLGDVLKEVGNRILGDLHQ
jgi:LysR family hydrogen peroxide-inducible transcriptional activator